MTSNAEFMKRPKSNLLANQSSEHFEAFDHRSLRICVVLYLFPQQVCDMMCASVREQMMLGVNDYLVIDRTQWMQNWPGQIVLNGSQVGAETALASSIRASLGYGLLLVMVLFSSIVGWIFLFTHRHLRASDQVYALRKHGGWVGG